MSKDCRFYVAQTYETSDKRSITMGVLKGIKVVDVTIWAFVPCAGAVLAHWGVDVIMVDVIMIEHPRNADPMRSGFGSPPGSPTSIGFRHYNLGRLDITLGLTTDDDCKILYKLVESADVFLTSYLTATRKTLMMDVDDIRAVHPKIIYAKGTGRGPRGPEAKRAATTAYLMGPRLAGGLCRHCRRHRMVSRDDSPW